MNVLHLPVLVALSLPLAAMAQDPMQLWLQMDCQSLQQARSRLNDASAQATTPEAQQQLAQQRVALDLLLRRKSCPPRADAGQ